MSKKIIIIEDEPDILTYLTAVLEDHGFDVFTVFDHMGVAEAVSTARPDLILLDVMMPRRSGVSIYKELRSSPQLRAIPVAIISGFSPEGDDMASGFRCMLSDEIIQPPSGYLDKPVDRRALIDTARRLTAQREELT